MKRNTKAVLPVKISGLPSGTVSQIDFVFKQRYSENDPILKQSTYKSNGTGDVTLRPNTTNVYEIPWTEQETSSFAANHNFYMDTKITISGLTTNPETPIVTLTMNPTLFKQEVQNDTD